MESISGNSSDPSRTHLCTCKKYCKGHKWVISKTYKRHEEQRMREDDDRIASAFQKIGEQVTTSRRAHKKRKRGASDSISTPAAANSTYNDQQQVSQPRATALVEDIDQSDSEGQSPDARNFNNASRCPTPDNMDMHNSDGESPPTPPDQQDIGDVFNNINQETPPPPSDDEFDAFDTWQANMRRMEPDEPLSPPMYPPLQFSYDMIANIKNATLEDDIDDPEVLEALRNPPTEAIQPDPLTKLAMRIFDSVKDGSEEMYKGVKEALEDHIIPILIDSYHTIRRKIERHSGIIKVETDMCINSCLAFTGPFADHLVCFKCGADRYEEIVDCSRKQSKKVKRPRQRFYTVPLGPQLQALWRSPEGADRMEYRMRKTREVLQQITKNNGIPDTYEDVFDGTEYLEAYSNGKITEHENRATL